MSNEKLPKVALNKPNIKGAEVIATDRGWEAVYAGRDSNELLVEHKGLKTAIAGYAGYLVGFVSDAVESLVDDVKDSVGDTVGELKDTVGELAVSVEDKITDLSINLGKVEEIVSDAVVEIIEVFSGEVETVYSRETLTALEYSLLVQLAKDNEVEGRSRVDLVDGLCKVFDLA